MKLDIPNDTTWNNLLYPLLIHKFYGIQTSNFHFTYKSTLFTKFMSTCNKFIAT